MGGREIFWLAFKLLANNEEGVKEVLVLIHSGLSLSGQGGLLAKFICCPSSLNPQTLSGHSTTRINRKKNNALAGNGVVPFKNNY